MGVTRHTITDPKTARLLGPSSVVPILYVEMNEDGTTGGSHVVMREIITRIPSPYQPVALFYQQNPVADSIGADGIKVVTWDAQCANERRDMAAATKVRKARLAWQQVAVRQEFLRREGIRLVHLGNSPFVGGDTWLPACLLAGVPCVVYSMGDADTSVGPFRRWLYRRYDRVLPNSRYLAESLSQWGYPTAQTVLAYPGLDFDAIEAAPRRAPDEVRHEFGVASDQLLVTMVGNVREWKGQHVLVDALRRLTETERAHLHVLLVGATAGSDQEYLEQLTGSIRDHGLTNTITLTGQRVDVPSLLGASDIAVHASIKPEPFGLVVLEAMAAGCAVIAARDGGPSEMIDAESGLLVNTTTGSSELSEALRTLLHHPESRRAMAAHAARRARTFDVREHVRTVCAVYEELLG